MGRGKALFIAAALLLSPTASRAAGQPWSYSFCLSPGGMTKPSSMGTFAVSRTVPLDDYPYSTTDSHSEPDTYFFSPMVFMGADYDFNRWGAGGDFSYTYLGLSNARGNLWGLDASVFLPVSHFRPRLKAGVSLGTMNWRDSDGLTRASFKNALGWQMGIAADFGSVVAPFYAELVYRGLRFEVDRARSDMVSRSSLDLSGWALGFGAKFNFGPRIFGAKTVETVRPPASSSSP